MLTLSLYQVELYNSSHCNTLKAKCEYKAPNAAVAAVVSGTVVSGENGVISYKTVARVTVYGDEPSLHD